jgi:anti-sigma factor RsiW
MHEPVKRRLEDYLSGRGPYAEVEAHLKSCRDCREELEAMQASAAFLQSLRTPEVEPSAGFYARVMNRVEAQVKSSVWSLFGESLFAKRLGYASATFLLLLGSLLFTSTEMEEPLAAANPESIFSGEVHPVPVSMEDQQQGRDVVLVNLATYRDYE